MDGPLLILQSNLQGVDIVAAGERSFDRLQDRSEMCVCWHRYPTRW